MATKNRRRRGPTKESTQSASTITTLTEDGTQVERKATRKRKGGVTQRRVVATNDAEDDALRDFIRTTCEVGVKGLTDVFIKLKFETQTCTKPKTAFDGHLDKNRYKDVICIDETRVVLKYPEGSDDYIHANWVKAADNSNRFICTQGPTEKTTDDFWRMVWQERAVSILMLCNLSECGKKKCEQYWPITVETPMSIATGKLAVKLVAPPSEVESNIVLTKLMITDEKGNSHVVDHWQWKAWPDRGVPETSMATFRLLAKVRKATPLVVHCSAGIGRTGTIVGLDVAYTKLCAGEKISLEKIVRDMRNQRHGSVQTDAQYIFMHRVLLSLAENKKVTTPEMAAFISDYDKIMATKAG